MTNTDMGRPDKNQGGQRQFPTCQTPLSPYFLVNPLSCPFSRYKSLNIKYINIKKYKKGKYQTDTAHQSNVF